MNSYSIIYRRLLLGISLYLLSLGAFAGMSVSSDVKILHSDRSALVIEFTPIYTAAEKFTAGGIELTKVSFLNNVPNNSFTAGMPDIRTRSILIRLAGPDNNKVEIISADYVEETQIVIPPVPGWKGGDVSPAPIYEINNDAYSVSQFLPGELATLISVGETRGKFLGSLELSPLQYNPLNKSLRKYTRIVVQVTFGPAAPLQRSMTEEEDVAVNDKTFSADQKKVLPKRSAKEIKNSVLASGIWYRFSITDEGMYKINGQQLLDAGIPSSINPRTVKIYGNGGAETPLSQMAPYIDDLLENAVLIYDGGTIGYLDAEDYMIFFGRSIRSWNYTALNKSFNHLQNRFARENIYWLTYGGSDAKMMSSSPSLTDAGPLQPATVIAKVFREDEKVNVNSSGVEWLGDAFTPSGQMVYRHSLPGLDVTQPITYKITVGARSYDNSYFSVYEHDGLLGNVNIPRTGGDYPPYFNSVINTSKVPNFSDGETRLRFTYTVSGSRGIGYLDWYEVYYYRFLQAENDVFMFHAPDTSEIIEYRVSGLSGGNILVFDISKFDSVFQISGPRISMDTCTFQTAHVTGRLRSFYVVGQNGFKSVGTLTSASNQNLHGDPYEADCIIISHSDFLSAAQRLKEFREGQSEPLKTLVVNTDQIYNEFGGGLFTPAAIRNYLRYVYLNWSKTPRYVLLLGDGDYDYKRIISAGTNWIPAWETEESFLPLSSYASDDPFGIFFLGNRVSLGIGRLTCRSTEEAHAMVDKIIEYESGAVSDPWKLRFTFVADDGLAGAGDSNNGIQHTEDADALSKMVPDLFEKQKIYLYEYPTVYTVGGRRKPAVNTAIQNAINQGTLILNFSGHGNPRLWTHEAVFVRETDFAFLNNKGKYFFLVAATCNYANFDLLNEQSSAEVLVAMHDAGAIAVFSATRAVFADANFFLNKELYNNLLDTTIGGNIRQQRLGDLVYKTKQVRSGENDRKYFLLGDPAIRLAFPKGIATVDSINGQSLNQVVTLSALSRTSVLATVRDSLTLAPLNFLGQAQVVVFDANKNVTITEPERNESMTFAKAGSVLFRGEAAVTDGSISTQFIVPKDISYRNERGRITIYCWNDSSDGAGYTTSVQVGGIDTTAVADTEGPKIQIFLDSRSYRPGDVVKDSPTLIVDLTDSSGINTSGAGIGHRLETWLDDSPESIDITDYYKSKVNTYREGSVEYSLGSLTVGTHKLRVRAWDTYNNYSTEETVFDVETSIGLRLFNVYNYPNPFRSMTYFTFEHNQTSPLDVEVKIYTVAGRCIQTLKQSGLTDRPVKVLWDGVDRDGDALANGVYLYKIIAKTLDGRFSDEELGKLSILR
jgi:hypothetical protein